MHEAMFWSKKGDNIECELCPRFCSIPDGKTGFCRIRKNIKGKLYTLTFGKPVSVAIDPIEKKPLYHFLPGTETLSVATVGCNLACQFCQNWEISQPDKIFGEDASPEKIAEITRMHGLKSIAWTYTEPTVFYEFFYETKKICDIKHIWVSNGFTNPEPIKKAEIDAVNVDIKGNNEFYKKHCSAWIEPILKSLQLYKKLGVWVEVTNLIIPGHNDSEKVIKDLVDWIGSIDRNIPLHISRYYPAYKFTVPMTPVSTLEKAYKMAKDVLNFVYIGNVVTDKENTECPECNTVLIKRKGFYVEKINLEKRNNKVVCPECSKKIPVVFE